MRHSPSINYYYYMTEQGEHANSGTNVMWANNEPWPTTTNLPISLTINMLGQWCQSVISKHEYAWIRIDMCLNKYNKVFPNTPTGFRRNPVYHYLVKQAVNPCYWLSQKLTCLDAQTSRAMLRQGHRVTHLYYLCKWNWFSIWKYIYLYFHLYVMKDKVKPGCYWLSVLTSQYSSDYLGYQKCWLATFKQGWQEATWPEPYKCHSWRSAKSRICAAVAVLVLLCICHSVFLFYRQTHKQLNKYV